MTRFLLLAYIFFVSWTGAFALSSWFRLHYVISVCALTMVALTIFIRGGFKILPYKSDDLLILLFLFMFILAALFNANGSSLNYIAIYAYVLIFLYLVMKGALFSYLKSRQIFAANLLGVACVGAFLSINFILDVSGVINLQEIIPRLRDTTATYGGRFIRGYGFSTEPGIVAYYLNTLGPLAMWYLWSGLSLNKSIKWIVTSLVVFGWLVTFSAGGVFMLIMSLLISIIILGVRSYKGTFRLTVTIKSIFLLMVLVAGIIYVLHYSQDQLLRPMYMKFTLSNELNTVTDRLNRIDAGYSLILDKPLLGYGPGYFSSIDEISTINWYLMILAEGGFLSLIPLVVFLGLVLIRIVKFQHPSRFAILVGFIAACGHLMITTTSGYLHPFLWLLVAIFYAQLEYSRLYRNQSDFQSTRTVDLR